MRNLHLTFDWHYIRWRFRKMLWPSQNIWTLLSKGHFGFFNSPKKRTKNFCPSRLGQKLTFLSSFFGRIEDTKISFWDQLTFSCFDFFTILLSRKNFHSQFIISIFHGQPNSIAFSKIVILVKLSRDFRKKLIPLCTT